MILILHLAVAFGSMALAAYLFVRPSKRKLHGTYALVTATLVSGSYLVISKPAHLTQVCVTGLVYLTLVSYGILSARHKLAVAAK